jgi:hypothetical protein
MVSTIPRLRTSSATSRGVQWLTGRPESAGSSHATATSWTICSAGKVAGVPERGESVEASTLIGVSTFSGPPSASICSSLGARASQRWRHGCTVPRLRRIWRVTWHWLAPVSSAQRILARRTSRWGLVCRRAICSKQARCRAVSCTLWETMGAGAMAVGIRNSFRENWALFSSYDTMPPSVRILLPSTTSRPVETPATTYLCITRIASFCRNPLLIRTLTHLNYSGCVARRCFVPAMLRPRFLCCPPHHEKECGSYRS